MEDRGLVYAVQLALANSVHIGHLHRIKVSHFENILYLDGDVDTEDEKERAGKIASRVDGVEKVVNNLKVHPPMIEQL